ncbi:MAG: helicase-exonuclease AddAB subunit AddA [Clostridia bacterium]|nr:helicase-exonuclease AddAB subunit AddA [Clostridia bacterium]
MDLTDSQKAAIDAKEPFIIVSAAAGSGKTHVLTERIVSRLCDKYCPFDISRLLIVTYTKAAAAEMRSRIANKLTERIKMTGADVKRLRRQISNLGSAHIQTVHSFCADFLRKNFDKCGLSPDFSVCDDLSREQMQAKCIDALLEEVYAEQPEGFTELSLALCGERDDKRLIKTILKIYEKIQAHPKPEEWIRKQLDEASADTNGTLWGKYIVARAGEMINNAKARWDSAKDLADEETKEANAGLISAYDALFESLTAPRDLRDFPGTASILDSFSPPSIKNSKTDFASGRDFCKEALNALRKYLSTFGAQDGSFENEKGKKATKCLCNMLLRFGELYAAEKRRRKTVDYSDLEHMTLYVLENSPETANALREHLQELLVDEYQDTNEVQDRIFSLIAPAHGSSFFVGDVKQSIYGFRLADPSIFIKRYKEASPDGKDGKRRIDMSVNFRSRPEVIDLCNYIFERTMSESLGDVDYDENQRLNANRSEEGGVLPSEVCLIDSSGIKDVDEDGTAYEAEAIYAARRIKELLSSAKVPIKDTTESRPAEFGDFAILLSSLKSNSGVFRRALEREGLPCAVDAENDFTVTLEGTVIYSLLKIIDNPRQDVPLLSVLYSPLFSFTADELALIRADAKKDDDLWDAVRAASEKNEKCRAFIGKISDFMRAARIKTASSLLQYIYNETNAYGVFSAFPSPAARAKTLDAFYETALAHEGGAFFSCAELVSLLDAAADSENKPKTSNGSGVRVMSIHRSKGLEFPFVFVCLLGKDFNKQDVNSEPVLVDKDLGFALKFVDKERRMKKPSGKAIAVKGKMEAALKSEEMRKLYVAFTRARERLFLVMSNKYLTDPASKSGSSLRKLYLETKGQTRPQGLTEKNSALPWIVTALFSHPDAGPLISYTADAGKCDKTPTGRLVCKVIDGAQLFEKAEKAPAEKRQAAPVPAEYAPYIADAEKEYPFLAVSALPSKMTPTEISDEAGFDPSIYEYSGGRDAKALGTAFHLFLEKCDFKKCADKNGVRAEKERVATLYPDVAKVDESLLSGFFESDLGRRAAASEKMLREYTFSVLLPPADLARGDVPGEKILLSGSVDLAFFEDGGITVVDFKTDSVKPGLEAKAAERHRPQVELYEKALREIFEEPVKQKTVFFLKTGKGADL